MTAPRPQAMRLSHITWNPATGTVEMVLTSAEPPPRPEWVREDLWYGGAGDRLAITVPARKIVNAAPQYGIAGSVNPDGSVAFTRYTYNGTAWASPVPCDHQGNPL